MILLDTQAFVWMFTDDPMLGQASRQAADEANNRDQAYVAAISFWEIAMLTEKRRLSLGMDVAEWVETALAKSGIGVTTLTPAIAVQAGRLPEGIHGDPADRIIVATARSLNCTLLTTDRMILSYAREGHVRASDARL